MAVSGLASISARTAAQLRDGGPATVNDISRTLELSRTSVENAISALADLNLITEAPAENGRGAGRPARRYVFHGAAGAVVGVDVGISSIRVVVTDIAGAVCAQRTLPGIADAPDGAAKLAAVVAGIRSTLVETSFAPSAIRAIGVALPGIVDDAGQVVTSVIIPEWSGVDIGSQLRQAFGCPVALDNGVRLAAVAEHHMGVSQLVDDVVYLSVGHRIAMGLILGGKPRRGIHNIAGDIGRLAFRGLDSETGSIEWRTAGTAEEVFARARGGDEAAQTELASFIEEVAHGIAMIVMTVDPAMVVIGGGLSLAHDQFLDPLQAAVPRHIGLPIQIPLVEARLGAEAAAHGALVHAFRRYGDVIYGIPQVSTPPVRPLAEQVVMQ